MSENNPLSDAEIESLYNSVMSPSENDPFSNQVNQVNQVEKKYNLNGKDLTPDELYNLASEYTQKQSEYESKYKNYEEVDKYAQSNPDWWNHVTQNYQNKNNSSFQNNKNEIKSDLEIEETNLSPELQFLNQELKEVKNFINSFKSEIQIKQQKEEDNLLDIEINRIKGQYNYINFDEKDQSGMTVEQSILKHAQEIGTRSFEAAFKSKMHDKLIAKAIEQGKESLNKDLEKKTKLGILGVSDKPVLQNTGNVNRKNQSYQDLATIALQELGV